MKTLTNEQTIAISGASKGIIYEDGVAYPLNCPSISQPCLDKYLICLEIPFEDTVKLDNCVDKVSNECEGLYGVIKMYNCLDAHGL